MNVPFVNLILQNAPHLGCGDRTALFILDTIKPSGNVNDGLTVNKLTVYPSDIRRILIGREVSVIRVVPEVKTLVRLKVALLRPFPVQPFEVLAQALALGLRHRRGKVEL